ncbi:MAG: hypothetical protein ACO20H_10175 [Bacteriovoracaceae bacterium]
MLDKLKLYLYDHLTKLKHILAQEGKETKYMLEVYIKFTRGKADKSEMKKANQQFRDLLKSAGLGVFLILPFAPITIPLVVKFSRKLGVELLPQSVREQLPMDQDD